MADWSEFPTTPTAWQESYGQAFEPVTAVAAEDPPAPARRGIDVVGLVLGAVFVLIGCVALSGVTLSAGLLRGGLLWPVLIGAGVVLLLGELRRSRR